MFQAGFDKGVTWMSDSGGGQPVPINITGWQAEDGGDTPDISHTGTMGQQAFLAALARCPCSFTAHLDGDQTPKSVGITFGKKGTLAFTSVTQGGNESNSIHLIIRRVPYQSEVAGTVHFTVEAASDAINASGQVVNSINFN